MILQVSGRQDIVAFYLPWFMKRLEEGYVDVRNPYYPKQVSRVLLGENVDVIVFCTKNPIPLLAYVDLLKKYHYIYIIQVTLTPYGKDIEPYVPAKGRTIYAVLKLSELFGHERVMVRYDPILYSNIYTEDYHVRCFSQLLQKIHGYVDVVIISFVDMKKNTRRYQQELRELTLEEIDSIAFRFGKIASSYGIRIQTCGEPYDFTSYGFSNEGCLSPSLLFRLTGKSHFELNKNRLHCKCVKSVDIGSYNCCSHFCKYCYANYDEQKVKRNMQLHDDASTMVIGKLEAGDIVIERKK